MVSRRTVIGLVMSVVLVVAASGGRAFEGPPVEVTSCGQHVPGHSTGFLSADLTCATQVGVYLGRRARLDLRGFTLAGGDFSVGCEPFSCDSPHCVKNSRCEVFGGTLTGAGYAAIAGGRVAIHDLTISNARAYAVLAFSRIYVANAQISATSTGLQANKRIEIQGSTLVETQVQAERVLVRTSSITGNKFVGAIAGVIELFDSDLTGNGTSPDCGSRIRCADIASRKRPWVDAASTCDRSVSSLDLLDLLKTWEVCALD